MVSKSVLHILTFVNHLSKISKLLKRFFNEIDLLFYSAQTSFCQ